MREFLFLDAFAPGVACFRPPPLSYIKGLLTMTERDTARETRGADRQKACAFEPQLPPFFLLEGQGVDS